VAVVTSDEMCQAFYAVLATDENLVPASEVVPGHSATTIAVNEQPAPIQPIKVYDSTRRGGPYVGSTSITGKPGLPLHVTLHGSQSRGGGAGDYGDYYLYFGTPQMGYRDGLAGVFSVEEHRGKDGNRLLLRVRDAVEHPSGKGAMETYWFGYQCIPQGAGHTEPRVYPFTENQILWITRWVVATYQADPQRVTIGGNSSGAVGSLNVGFRHPELFAAAYPTVGRVRRVPAIALDGKFDRNLGALMSDGTTPYYDRVDGPKFAAQHPEDLPFLGWACGRQDGYATWQEHIDMVRAMTEARHGFAFSWNNGNHGGGGAAMQQIQKYYPAEKFALKRSYPAFSHSSLDDELGSGDPQDGDLVGGINLGFVWNDVRDEADRWSVAVSNELAKAAMTVDVTPRRCQTFQPLPGDTIRWSALTGESGSVVAGTAGRVTIPLVRILPDRQSVLTLSRE
jgi:poly(3-hydroxybutyrate) depolymerase